MARGDERVTGSDAIIKIPSGETVPVSNVSWDRNAENTEVQHTQGPGGGKASALKPTRATTSLTYEGSFEYDGSNEELIGQVWDSNGIPIRVTMTIKEETDTGSDRTVTFENVTVEGQSRDIPSDDVSSTSWDFVAENMNDSYNS